MSSLPPKDKEEVSERDEKESEVASLIARTSVASLGLNRSPSKPLSSSNAKRQEAAPPGFQYHVLGKVDTLAGLAVRYQTTTDELKRLNKLFSDRDMLVRHSLLVPVVLDAAALEQERAGKIQRFFDRVGGSDRCIGGEQQARLLLGKWGWSVERAVAAFEEAEESERAQQQALLEAAERAQRDATMQSGSGGAGGDRASLSSSYSSAEEELPNPTGFFGRADDGPQNGGKKRSEDDSFFNEL